MHIFKLFGGILFSNLRAYLSKDALIIFQFGMTSGIMLMLTGNTLNFWLSKSGINLKTIGLFSLIAIPYILKYFIAPFLEKYYLNIGGYGRRKSWLKVFAILFLCLAVLLGKSDPVNNILDTAILGLLLSLVAVGTDIILDSYRVDISNSYDLFGTTSSMFVFGYKMGMLLSSAGAIFLSITIPWQNIYLLFAVFIFLNLYSFIYFIDDQQFPETHNSNEILSLRTIFLKPIKQFSSKREFIIVVVFILLYKIADHFVLSMLNPFLLSMHYNEYDISFVAKTFGFIASIIGSLFGGVLIQRYGIKSCLFYFALFHSLTNLLFIVQNHLGHNISMLYVLTGFGTISAGMTMSVYISYIMSICGQNYTGTKYAFFSSLMGCSRVLLPSSSGFMVEFLSWDGFFILMMLLSLPGILLVKYLPQKS